MGTTTIRVDDETHARLLELSAASDATLIDTVRAATDALERQRFADRVTRQLDALRADPDAWADYLAEGETTSVSDGIGW